MPGAPRATRPTSRSSACGEAQELRAAQELREAQGLGEAHDGIVVEGHIDCNACIQQISAQYVAQLQSQEDRPRHHSHGGLKRPADLHLEVGAFRRQPSQRPARLRQREAIKLRGLRLEVGALRPSQGRHGAGGTARPSSSMAGPQRINGLHSWLVNGLEERHGRALRVRGATLGGVGGGNGRAPRGPRSVRRSARRPPWPSCAAKCSSGDSVATPRAFTEPGRPRRSSSATAPPGKHSRPL